MNAIAVQNTYSLMADLPRLTGIADAEGAVVMAGRDVVEVTLPWSEERTTRLGRMVDSLCGQLLNTGRSLETIFLEFEEGSLLISVNQGLRLVLLLPETGENLDRVAEEAGQLLAMHAPALLDAYPGAKAAHDSQVALTVVEVAEEDVVPDDDSPGIQLEEVTDILTGRLAMVMGRKGATTLVSKHAETLGLPEGGKISETAATSLLQSVMQVIPNRTKRGSLTHECEQLLAKSLS